jgi:HlyD family secretion protein
MCFALEVSLAYVTCLACIGCGNDAPELSLVGTVERTEVELVAPVSETLIAVHAQRGERVQPGKLLIELDPTYARVEVARAAAALVAAHSAQLVARQEHERARHLRSDHVLSQQDLDRARLAEDEARARVREAEAQVAASHKRKADLSLVAPVAGVVDQLPFDAGERVPAGAVLAVILSDGMPWVRVWVPEESYVRVAPGTPAEIEIDGVGRTLRGSVLDISRDPEFTPHYALTERDRVHLVYETRVGILDAPTDLRPGAPAQVRILAPPHVANASP